MSGAEEREVLLRLVKAHEEESFSSKVAELFEQARSTLDEQRTNPDALGFHPSTFVKIAEEAASSGNFAVAEASVQSFFGLAPPHDQVSRCLGSN
jgi:hypothetical protein